MPPLGTVGGQILAEYNAGTVAGSPQRKYAYGGYVDEPLALIDGPTGGVAAYYHQNGRYDVITLSDATGAVAERYAYDAYGNTLIFDGGGTNPRTTSALGNRFGFTGRERDAESGLYYFRARNYDCALGRFVGRDPSGYADGLNLYAGYFVPDGADPSGLISWTTDYWYERHHWFPRAKRKQIETLCKKVGFNIDAFVTPLLAARRVPTLSWWDSITGVKQPPGYDDRSSHDHAWLHHWRPRKWNDIVDSHLQKKSCCLFLTAMMDEIRNAYEELQDRAADRGGQQYKKPIELNTGVYVDYNGTGTFPIDYWYFDEMGEGYDYSLIQTWPLLELATQMACKKKRRKRLDCKEWVNEQRQVTPLSAGGLQPAMGPEIFFGGGAAGFLRKVGRGAAGGASGPVIYKLPPPTPQKILRRAG